MGSKRATRVSGKAKGTVEESWGIPEATSLHLLDKRVTSPKTHLSLKAKSVHEAWLKGIQWLVTSEQALWQVRGVQFMYPGAYIRIDDPLDNLMSLGKCCYTKSKWTTFRKQYKTAEVLRVAREAHKDSEGTATWVDTYRADVPRLSGKGGCLTGVTFITSPSKGSHVSFHFRAAEFTWRHSVDYLFITRLLQLAPDLPRPITVHLHYGKLFLNTMFLPMLRVSLGIKAHDKLMSMAYPRLQRQWANNTRKYLDPRFDPEDQKMKAILRAMKWSRFELRPQKYDWEDLDIG